MTLILRIASAALATAALLALPGWADDWPQWRGPTHDGVWRETGILESFPAAGLKYRWRARIGPGYSGPVVAQGRVFVTDRQLRPDVERVLCFEEATGKSLWVQSYPCDYEDMQYDSGPRASPTVHEGKVYTLGARGHLYCLDAGTGAVVWNRDLIKDYDAPKKGYDYGTGAAPLVVGDLLIVCAGGKDATVVALDRNTGKERWKALKDRLAYSAPIVVMAGGCQQLIVWTGDAITGFEPASGKVYWQVPRKSTFSTAEVVATPVLHKDMLLCLGAWGRSSMMLKLDAEKPAATVLWKSRQKPSTLISTPIFQDDGHFYALDYRDGFCCLDAASGEKQLWCTAEPAGRDPWASNLHMTPNGDRVFLFNQFGHLIVARLTPRGYQEISRCLLVEATGSKPGPDAVAWAHPAYANKCVFARNDRTLVCVSLAADQGAGAAVPLQTVNSRVLGDFRDSTAAYAVAFSPDGKTLALGTGGLDRTAGVKMLDLATGKLLASPPRQRTYVHAVAISPDGKRLASAGGSKRNGEIKLWDLADGKDAGQLTGHTSRVTSTAFAHDSQTLATGSIDGTARLWDVATAKERAVLKGHGDGVGCVAFSADGKLVASASWDRTVKLWDAASGQERATLKGHDEEVLAVALSPDGKTMATGSADWTVRLWDLPAAKERAVLTGHQGSVGCLAFSSDGRTLASGSGDETVKLWDVAAAKESKTLRGHRSGIAALAFSPDARTLISVGMDNVRIWELASK